MVKCLAFDKENNPTIINYKLLKHVKYTTLK